MSNEPNPEHRSPALQEAHERFKHWAETIRDPSNSVEPEELIITVKRLRVDLKVAEIASGWTWNGSYFDKANGSGGCTTWNGVFATREEAIGDAVERLKPWALRRESIGGAELLEQLALMARQLALF